MAFDNNDGTTGPGPLDSSNPSQNPASQLSPGASTTVADAALASAPLREDQVQNAVGFLTHPKVQGSPVAVKRSFLEKKGLTNAEINEAFRRVPEPAASPPPATTPEAQRLPQPQQVQEAQLQRPAERQMSQITQAPQGQATIPPPPAQSVHWSQVVLGVGVVAAGVYAITHAVIPYAQRAYQRWCDAAAAREEDMRRREQEIRGAVEALQRCEAQLKSTTDNLGEVVALMREPARMTMQNAAPYGRGPGSATEQQQLRQELDDLRSAISRSGGPTRSGPYHGSYGSKPDHLPTPGYVSSYPPYTSSSGPPSKAPSPIPGSAQNVAAAAADPKYPPSFHEVMEMVSKNITPPNVRTDINDTPPDPTRPLTDPRARIGAKPWETRGAPLPPHPSYPGGAAVYHGAPAVPGSGSSGRNGGASNGSTPYTRGTAYGNGSSGGLSREESYAYHDGASDPPAWSAPYSGYQGGGHNYGGGDGIPASVYSTGQNLSPPAWAQAVGENGARGGSGGIGGSSPAGSAQSPMGVLGDRDRGGSWTPPPPPQPTIARDAAAPAVMNAAAAAMNAAAAVMNAAPALEAAARGGHGGHQGVHAEIVEQQEAGGEEGEHVMHANQPNPSDDGSMVAREGTPGDVV